jgi:ubiquinone/menaquinone biosynthesis C-methylase UbiE
VSGADHSTHERRYTGGADRLRSPQRVALLETGRVVSLGVEGLEISSVLDVGTGTGIFAEAFADGSRRVEGIDPEPTLLEAARRAVPAAVFREGTAENLPFEKGSFDLVFFGHVLHETDNLVGALSEARRVARLRVVILEWPYRQEEMGPPLAHRLQPSRVLEASRAAGFSHAERIELAHMDLYRLAS